MTQVVVITGGSRWVGSTRPRDDRVFSIAMRNEDIIAFARRDWVSVTAVKERYWAKQKSSMTPAEALRLGDALRADGQVLLHRGPTPEEREEDFATHERVAEILRRGGTRRSR